jgi:hypothetical protein
VTEDKVSLARKRAELVESLAPHRQRQLPPEERMRLQSDLSVINAKIKALNTTQAARDKAAADRRKVAGLAEAQANAARARVHAGLAVDPRDGFVNDEDDDPGQTAAIDGWIDAVLLRHDVDFTRGATGTLMLTSDPSLPHIPQKLAATIEALVTGIYAAARGQELPDLSALPVAAPKTPKAPRPKPKKR